MKTRPHGFTLPEVLATLVLIGLVLPLVMQGVSLALGLAEDAAKRAEAAAFAQTKLNELVLGVALPTDASTTQDTEASGFRWESSEIAVDDGMRELTVEVTWTSRRRERSVTVSTWVAPETEEVLQ